MKIDWIICDSYDHDFAIQHKVSGTCGEKSITIYQIQRFGDLIVTYLLLPHYLDYLVQA